MLNFHPIELSDKQWIEPILKQSNFNGSEYTFANNYVWRHIFKFECCQFKSFYLLKTNLHELSFLYPTGSGDVAEVIAELKSYCAAQGKPLILISVLKQGLDTLEQLFPGQFEVNTNRDEYDYIYSTEDLITLKGKKFHSKRNHVNRFVEGNWKFEPITADNIEECTAMNREWCKINECSESISKQQEYCSVKESIKNFFVLGLQGALLRLDERVVAFTIGEPLNSDTFIVHIEKAFNDVQGAYPTINREFAEYAAKGFTYINREEDTGAEGLRKAKLSYNPVSLLEKYVVTFR